MRDMQKINICCSTDDNFAPYCGIMLTSLFENNVDNSICVFLLISGSLSKSNTDRFYSLANKYNQEIRILTVDDSFLKSLPLYLGRLTLATYNRLYIGDLLPKSVDKVLFLDSDMIVTSSIEPLWKTDITNTILAASPDNHMFSVQFANRTIYPAEYGHFNAGMMLVNLVKWRSDNVKQRCLDFLGSHYDELVYNDQDVLNAVLYREKIFLPLTFNFQVYFLNSYDYNALPENYRKEIRNMQTLPCIIHYAGALKPWNLLSVGILPFCTVWKINKLKSPWRKKPSVIPPRKTFNWMVKKYLLWPLGIKKDDLGFSKSNVQLIAPNLVNIW